MTKVDLYLFDIRDVSLEELSSLVITSSFDNVKIESARKEKLASKYLKDKYIKRYSIDKNGKPVSDNIYFNVSHSHEIVAIAVSQNHPIGLDIETNRKLDEKLVKYIASKEETKFIKDDLSFMQVWTSKESLLKCVGTGLKDNLKDVPALPLNGLRQYKNQTYFTKSIIRDGLVISISLQTNEEFIVNILAL